MFILTIVSSVLLAAAMGASFARKARGVAGSRQLRDRLHVSPGLWYAIGLLELCALIGLLAGLAIAPLGVAAAAGTVLLMLGAVISHLRVRITGAALTAPVTLLAIAVAVTALRLSTA